jgi:hypothetical protein
MNSVAGSYRLTVRGSPIRASTDHGMCAPPRRLSQLTTPFIAFTRLGIHRVPFVACQSTLALEHNSCVAWLRYLKKRYRKSAFIHGNSFYPYSSVKEPAARAASSSPIQPADRRRICEFARREGKSGGGEGTRTPDPLLAKQVLCQLSYTPTRRTRKRWWAWEDLNFRPHAYQACALAS